MKRTYFFGILLTALGTLLGCSDAFINLDPVTAATPTNFYRTANDFTNALNATYARLQGEGLFANDYVFGDIATDNSAAELTACISGHCDFDNFQVLPGNSTAASLLNSRWQDAYQGISRANALLDRLPAASFDEALKKRLGGEAQFLRALFYFKLATTFGDVPLTLKEITSPAESYALGREPVAKVFDQIETDLKAAATALPERYTGSDVGRATSGSAKALLGRTYLTRKKWGEAVAVLKEVEAGKVYSLLPAFADVFRADNGNNAEIVFAVQYTRGGVGEGSGFGTNFAPRGSGTLVTKAGSPNGSNTPTVDILRAYEPGDLRFATTLDSAYTDATGKKVFVRYVKKYLDAGITAAGDGANDWPVIRYSDVLLMLAEALNETGQPDVALPYLNAVRKRAGLKDKTALTQAALRLAIEGERRVEFAFEGLRYYDLLRTDRLLPVMNAYFRQYAIRFNGATIEVKPHQTLLPVPQVQMDVNPGKITQNPGY